MATFATRFVLRAALGSALLAGAFAGAAQPALAVNRVVYSDTANPHADIQQALAQALKERKRVILDFGGNWCGDCIVLDMYFHDEKNLSLLDSNYVLVHVNIGNQDMNTDIAEKYGIDVKKGVPALAVLNGHGKLLYSQRNHEFSAMRRMDESSVTEFLNQWKPDASPASASQPKNKPQPLVFK